MRHQKNGAGGGTGQQPIQAGSKLTMTNIFLVNFSCIVDVNQNQILPKAAYYRVHQNKTLVHFLQNFTKSIDAIGLKISAINMNII